MSPSTLCVEPDARVRPHPINANVLFADMGTMWFLNVLYAPTLLLSQLYIAYRLILHLTGRSDRLATP